MDTLVPFIFIILVVGLIYAAINYQPPRKPTRGEVALDILGKVVVLAVLIWNEIQLWFENNRTPNSLGEMVRRELDAGNSEVITNILHGDTKLATKNWGPRPLSPELKRRFGNSNRIVIYP